MIESTILDSSKINKIVKISKFVSKFDMSLNKTIDWYLLNENFYKAKNIFRKTRINSKIK